MRILVLEDELKIASLLRRGLLEEGHSVDIARTGDDALWMAAAAEYDAVVLDRLTSGSTTAWLPARRLSTLPCANPRQP